MNLTRYLRLFLVLPLSITSCTVTNNLYINDPVPAGKGKVELYAGLGTGLMPKIDSTSENGDIHFSNDLSVAPNLCVGGRYGLGEQTDIRFALHLPHIISGFGLKAGMQQSIFKSWTKFNIALGADAGFVVAKDTLHLGDVAIALDPATKGAINADFFMPLSCNFNENYRIILTPRVSFNTIYIRRNQYEKKSQKYSPVYSALSLGAHLNRLYLEATVHYIDDMIIPGLGIVYIFDRVNDSIE
jgi:hypothetical protein